MENQIPFPGNIKKNLIILSSAESSHSMVSAYTHCLV